MKWISICLFSILSIWSHAQCPQVADGNGVFGFTPQWVSCNGANFTIFIQPNIDITNYTINWGDGTANTTGALIAANSFTTQHTYNAAVANYTLTITSNAGCVLTGTVIMEEPVNASIQIPIGGVTQICAPGDMQFQNSSTNVSSNTTFIWDFGDGSVNLNFGSGNAGQTVTHTYQQNTVNCVTQVTLSAENFCSFGNPTVATFNPVLIYDIDDAAITATDQFLCYPDTVVTFTNTTAKNCVPEGNTVQRYERWNFGNYWGTGQDSIIDWQPFDPPNRPGYTLAFPGRGTYTINMIDSNQCGQDPAAITITIGDAPNVTLTSNRDTICEGEQVTFTRNTTGIANQHRWDFAQGSGFQTRGNANQTRTYNNAGSYRIAVVANNTGGTASCTDTAFIDLEVLSAPNANITAAPLAACDSITTTFTDATTGPVTQWAWNFGNGSTSTAQNPGSQTYTTPGAYNVSLQATSANGCSTNDNTTVNVFATPIPAFTPQNVCEDVLATLSDQSVVGFGGPITSWNWTFGDGSPNSTAQNPTHTYINNGNYNVILAIATANCNATDTLPIVVEPKPTAAMTADTNRGCSPLPVTFTNTSTGAATYLWDFGDSTTATATSPTHVFNNTDTVDTTYTVRLISFTAFGCSDTTFDTVRVLGNPVASFTTLDTIGCGPYEVQFTNTSVGFTSLLWDFDDSTGSVAANPTKVFTNLTLFNTIYRPKLVITGLNGCTDTASREITVFPQPVYNFTPNPDSGCSPLVVNFTSQTGTPAVIFNWTFGDGDTTGFGSGALPALPKTTGSYSNPVHTYVNNSTNDQQFNITLITQSSNNCFDTAITAVTVYPNPTADFMLSPDSGCHPLPVNFTNNSLGGTSYVWEFGDGDTSQSGANSVMHTYTNTGGGSNINTVRLTATTANGCTHDTIDTVTVFPQIIADFTTDTVGCSPHLSAITNQSTGASLYQWDFGDGAASTLGAGGNPIGAVPNTTGSFAAPSHTYVNNGLSNTNVTLKLIAESQFGCQDSTFKTVEVQHLPQVIFNPLIDSGCSPHPVNFNNATLGATSYQWQFGDGFSSISNSNSVPHTYNNPGAAPADYTVQLTATTADGCMADSSGVIHVFPNIGVSFLADTIGCAPLVSTIVNQSFGASEYFWDFGDGTQIGYGLSADAVTGSANTSGTFSAPIHTYTNTGLVTLNFPMQMIGRSQWGCTDTASKNVLAQYRPQTQFNPVVDSGCSPFPIQFNNQTQGGNSYLWEFGDGGTDTTLAASLSHVYNNAGATPTDLTVRLTATTLDGCTKDTIGIIRVFPDIGASFLADTIGCAPLVSTIVNQSFGASEYFWDFGDGIQIGFGASANAVTGSVSTSGTFSAPVHNYVNTGLVNLNFPMQMIARSPWGCADTASTNALVQYRPVAIISPIADSGCSPYPAAFSNLSQGGGTFAWNFGDGSSATTTTAVHTYINPSGTPQDFTPILTATTADGCTHDTSGFIRVFPKVTANFTSDTAGCSPLPISFTNVSINADFYSWRFGDATPNSTAQNPFHIYQHNLSFNQTYAPRLISSSNYGCADTITSQITVYEKPNANFNVQPTSICSGLPLAINNGSFVNNYSYQWSVNGNLPRLINQASWDTTLFNTGVIPTNQIFNLVVETPRGCKDTLEQMVSLNPSVQAGFSFNDESCQPLISTFINTSSMFDPGMLWEWDFGDGTPLASIQDPVHGFVNTTTIDQAYNVRLIAISSFGCRDTALGTATVYPQPIANFIPTPVSQRFPDATVSVVNSTNLGTWNYQWRWGDGNTSGSGSPGNHTYGTWGTFEIQLLVSSLNCQDTVIKTIEILPPFPIVNITGNAEGCAPVSATFTNTSEYVDTYFWDFGNGQTSSLEEPRQIIYFSEGNYDVTLVVQGPGGSDSVTLQDAVQVFEQPIAFFNVSPTELTVPTQEMATFNFSTGATDYLWDFGDGNTSTEFQPTHGYEQPGNFTVSLTATKGTCDSTYVLPTEVIGSARGEILYPNAFTPNPNAPSASNGYYNARSITNDIFFPQHEGVLDYRLMIFNRWGELVFETTDVLQGWDGWYRGKLAPQDVYVWKVVATLASGENYTAAGDITLLR